jgi:hypothetical protein
MVLNKNCPCSTVCPATRGDGQYSEDSVPSAWPARWLAVAATAAMVATAVIVMVAMVATVAMAAVMVAMAVATAAGATI